MTPTTAEFAQAVKANKEALFAGTESYHWSQIWDLCEQLKFPCADPLFSDLLSYLLIHLDALEELDRIKNWEPCGAKE